MIAAQFVPFAALAIVDLTRGWLAETKRPPAPARTEPAPRVTPAGRVGYDTDV